MAEQEKKSGLRIEPSEWPLPEELPCIFTFEEILGGPRRERDPVATPESGQEPERVPADDPEPSPAA